MKMTGFRQSLLVRAPFALLFAAVGFSACSSDPEVPDSGDGDSTGSGSSAPIEEDMSDITLTLGGAGGGLNGGKGAGAGSGVEIMIIDTLPDGFVAADALGGWDVVGPVEDFDGDQGTECANVLRVITRDFPESHPDFQEGSNGLYLGIVKDTLGPDKKPELANPDDPDDLVSNTESFNQWYRNVEGENIPFVMDMWLEPVGDTFVFDSSDFFPMRGMGYALEDGGSGQADGFHFTTELHTSFQYKGGETFTFRGDDDVWVFINDKLAIDIGGVHGAQEASVDLDDIADEFNLKVGDVYSLDLFQAERQTVESNFRIETTLDFTDCGEILEVDIPVK